MSGNRRRDLCRVVLWGAVGFFVPWMVELCFDSMQKSFGGTSRFYRREAWEAFTSYFYLEPALIFAALFGLAALAAYLPHKGLHFGRSLIVVIGTTIFPTYVMALVGLSRMRNSLGGAKALHNCYLTAVIAGIMGFMIALRMGTERPRPIDFEETESVVL